MRKLPPAPLAYSAQDQASLRAAIEHEFAQMLRTGQAIPFFNLQSPDGSTWQLTISNTGVTTWTKLPART